MTNAEALLAAVIQASIDTPDDDTARLVYADAVQEDGDEERANLIRNGIICHCLQQPSQLVPKLECFTCEGKQWVPRCEGGEGCRERGYRCYHYPAIWTEEEGWHDDGPVSYFCADHAVANGFCTRCGHRLYGDEQIMCEECREEAYEEDRLDRDDWDGYHDHEMDDEDFYP